LVQPGESEGSTSQAHDLQCWEDMRVQLHDILAHEATYHAFLAYMVDAHRARSIESPAYHAPQRS
jgi:hypothetical protein